VGRGFSSFHFVANSFEITLIGAPVSVMAVSGTSPFLWRARVRIRIFELSSSLLSPI
jgi:hypothetical protein